MGEMLSVAGVRFEPHSKHFVHDAPDDEWLRFAGRKGWPVIARDKNFRYKPNEYAAFMEASVLSFIFTAGDLSGADTALLVLRAYPDIVNLASTASRPAIYSIDRRAKIRELALAKRAIRLNP